MPPDAVPRLLDLPPAAFHRRPPLLLLHCPGRPAPQVACAFAPVLFPAALSAGPDELRLAEETCATLISNALHIFNPAVAADVPVVTPQVLSVAAAVAAAAGQQQQQQAPALAQGQDVAQQEQQEEEEEEAYMQDGLFLLSVDVMVHDCVTYGLFGDSDDYYDGGDEYTNSGGGLVGYSSTGLRAEAEEVDVELGLGLALPVGRARAPAAAWAEPEHVQLPSTPAKPAHAPAAVPAAAQAGTKQPLGSHNGAGSALGADASAFVAAKARIHQKLGLDGSSHFCLISASPAASPCSSPGPGVAPGAHRGQQQQQQPHGKAAGWSAFAAPPPSSPWPCGAGAAFCGGDGEVLDMLQEQAALAEALSGGQGPLLGMTSTWPAVRRPSEGGAAAWAAVSPSGSLITAGSQPLALMMTRRGTMGSSSGGAGSPHTPAGLPASPRPGSNATLPLQQPQRRQTLGGSGEGSSSGGGSVASSPRAVAAAAVRPRGSDSDGGGRPPLAAAGSASLDVEPLGLVGITSVGLLLCRDEHGRLAPPQLLVRELPSSGSGAASQQQQQQLPVPVRELGLAAVAAEKEQLKRQLKEVAAAFERCTGRPMSPAEKEPLRPLYVRYHKLKAALLKAAAAPIAAHYHAHGGGHHLSSSNGSSASLRPVAV